MQFCIAKRISEEVCVLHHQCATGVVSHIARDARYSQGCRNPLASNASFAIYDVAAALILAVTQQQQAHSEYWRSGGRLQP